MAVPAVGGAVSVFRKVKATHAMVQQIDAAVNGKPPGATTMVSQVQDLHDQLPIPEPPEENGEAVLPLLRRLALDIAELKAVQGIVIPEIKEGGTS